MAQTTLPTTFKATKHYQLTDPIDHNIVKSLDQEIDLTLDEVATLVPGTQGDPGDKGDPGDNGLTILNGAIDPTTEGVDGDFYINTVSNKIFGPKATTWPSGVSLIGPAGAGVIGIIEPADGSISANQVFLWFDPTNGAAKLNIKGKSADGTVVTGQIALT
jgi:hypothetical protein